MSMQVQFSDATEELKQFVKTRVTAAMETHEYEKDIAKALKADLDQEYLICLFFEVTPKLNSFSTF